MYLSIVSPKVKHELIYKKQCDNGKETRHFKNNIILAIPPERMVLEYHKANQRTHSILPAYRGK
jgi:hypothetical protein